MIYGEWRCVCSRPYLVAVSGVGVSEPLDVVKHQPGQRDDHEDDEGDGDEHHRRPAHVFLQVSRPDGDRHGNSHVSLQQRNHLSTFWLRDHDGHHLTSAYRERKKRTLFYIKVQLEKDWNWDSLTVNDKMLVYF